MPRRRAGSAAGPATSAPAPARGARPRPPPGPAGRAPASPHRPAAPSPPRVGGCGDPRCPPRPAAPGLTLGTSAGEIGNGEETDKRELKKKKTGRGEARTRGAGVAGQRHPRSGDRPAPRLGGYHRAAPGRTQRFCALGPLVVAAGPSQATECHLPNPAVSCCQPSERCVKTVRKCA